jgi:imidazolonepropionase-like amidohydrolase
MPAIRSALLPFLMCTTLLLGGGASAHATEWTVVHAGRLLDVPGEAPRGRSSVIIRDGRVERIEAGFVDADALDLSEGDAVTMHDLSAYFVLPGLIDGHVHLTLQFSPGYRLEWVTQSAADDAMRAARYARITLEAGFTTVRDVGATSGDAIFALRDGIERGDVVGPRLFAAGSVISITGGHGDFSLGYERDVSALLSSSGICDGVYACRRAVRQQIKDGADHIKLTATAGVLSESAAGLEQQFFDDELEAIISTAHSMGRRVTAHAHGANGIKAALRAGVDTIEHGTFLDDEAVTLFRDREAFLAPTLTAIWAIGPQAEDPDSFMSDAQRLKTRQAMQRAREYARQAHEGGVKIVFATDAGVFPHGINAKEFSLLVEWAGMSPAEAIYSATVAGAENLGQSEHLGSLTPGRFGDLIAVSGDPLENVEVLEDVAFVMKEGRVYKAP